MTKVPNRKIAERGLIAGLFVAASVVMSCVTAAAHDDLDTTLEASPDGEGLPVLVGLVIDIQRRANAEIASNMNAIESGGDLGAFLVGLGIAFAYGAIHAFGPGHGKFLIVSYFLGQDARVARGIVMAIQIAVVHVIAAVIVVWVADTVLRTGFGIRLSDVPGVRAASFLIIVCIGIYMFYRAIRISRGADGGHSHGHGDHHHHGHHHGHDHGHHHHVHHHHGGQVEGGLLALAAGMVPCPGAVLVMLYAVANDMIVPGFLLVAAMSLGIGLSICTLGVGAILARQTAMRVLERSGDSGSVATLRNTLNYAGAVFVTLIGLVSFVAFLDAPPL